MLLDNYLFGNSESGINVGLTNVPQLFDALLPDNLAIPYHITIISEHHDNSTDWQKNIETEIRNRITQLREYEIIVEVLFQKHEDYHKRLLITNYTNSSCDKGYSMFRVACGKTVRAKNDLRINTAFNNIQQLLGDTEYKSMHNTINLIKKINGNDKVWENRLFNNVD